MDSAVVTVASLKSALQHFRHGGEAASAGLLSLRAVADHRERMSLAGTRPTRAGALADLLRETVVRELCAVRGEAAAQSEAATARGEVPSMGEATSLLKSDFAAGDPVREAWSALYYRYLDPHEFSVRQIATLTQPSGAEGRRQVHRRLLRGFQMLARLVREAERVAEIETVSHEAAGRPATAPGVAPAGPTASPRTASRRDGDELLDALLASVRKGEAPVPLSNAQTREVALRTPGDLTEYRLGRVAQWSQELYRLDRQFVDLGLLIDQGDVGEHAWLAAGERRCEGLRALLDAVADPAVVILGPPGSGKSTLLRHFELETARTALRCPEPADLVPFFVQLNRYSPHPGSPPSAPAEWLAGRWEARYPRLPSLQSLLAEGRMVLLLDALNEMPAASEAELRDLVRHWGQWLATLVEDAPGNRIVFSCRTLDYSQPLSSPDLRVPQARIQPLTDEKVIRFLELYAPAQATEIWRFLVDSPNLGVLRSPYLLALLADEVTSSGELVQGRASLFTGFVRNALRREVERGTPVLGDGRILDPRDLRRVTRWQWSSPWDLPERGPLVPALARLAHAMQASRPDGERSQVRIDYGDALRLLDCDDAEAIVAAGSALGVLDEDVAAGQIVFGHQLMQEYFAARHLVAEHGPAPARREWRARHLSPTTRQVIEGLAPAEPLPPLPSSGWEETTILAAAMADDAAPFLRGVMDADLVLAGRAAAQPDVRPRLTADLVDELRWALARRSRDAEADLRARIEAAIELGHLGDPRFDRRSGPYGEYLWPPMVEVPGGIYPIGDDEPIAFWGGVTSAHMPRHEVSITAFRIGQFAVTNAEFACFMAAGGYDDERWWDTAASRAWRLGIGTAAAAHAQVTYWRAVFAAQPSALEDHLRLGLHDRDTNAVWQRRLAMTDEEFAAHLREVFPERRVTQPRFWQDERYDNPGQPTVGICWYEARAYCSWLAAQTGLAVRLPTEAEWEVCARGRTRRRYAYGDSTDPLLANSAEAHLFRPSPVGVFVEGDTPEGVSDLAGNSVDCTSSAFGRSALVPDFPYPYRADGGAEEADTPSDVLRVIRGGSWNGYREVSLAAFRVANLPANGVEERGIGFRIAAPAG